MVASNYSKFQQGDIVLLCDYTYVHSSAGAVGWICCTVYNARQPVLPQGIGFSPRMALACDDVSACAVYPTVAAAAGATCQQQEQQQDRLGNGCYISLSNRWISCITLNTVSKWTL